MPDDPALGLSIGQINRRLIQLARESKRLKTLLGIAIEAQADGEKFGGATPRTPEPEPARPEEVGHA
jgi:hypothetical protein